MSSTKYEKDRIVELYLDGYSAKSASEMLGYSYSVCYRELKKRNIKIRNNSEANKLLSGIGEDKRQLMSDMYNKGYSSSELSKMFGLSSRAILEELKHRTKIREPHEYNRKHKVNDNYFDQIDSEDKAYWLGFLATDGSVSKSKNLIQIGLKKSDYKHLEKFNKYTDSNFEVKIYKKVAYLVISSKNIHDKLMSFGIIPNKSLILCCPKVNKFEKDFWRGCIDGDGCICIDKNSKVYLKFCGSFSIVQAFIEFINRSIKCRSRKPHKCKNIYQTGFSGNIARNIISILYKNNTISLDRKNLLSNKIIGD